MEPTILYQLIEEAYAGTDSMSRDDLANFLERLAESAETERESEAWSNITVPDFLRSWAAWIPVMDRSFANNGLPIPEKVTWQLIAVMLTAAAIYE